MPIPESFKDVQIKTMQQGFYQGLNFPVTIISKLLMVVLICWVIVYPEVASEKLANINSFVLGKTQSYYIYSVSLFVIFCLVVAFSPAGKIKMGRASDTPEFSNISWFAMMFGAGMGAGLLFWSTTEPLYHFASNPDTIQGLATGKTDSVVPSTFRYTFLHWGFHAWAIYAIVGLSLGYFCHRRGLPLTIRSTLTPLLGEKINGPIGHLVDIIAVVATILGIAITVGLGVGQFASGMDTLVNHDWAWLMSGDAQGKMHPSKLALGLGLALVMLLATISALTGIGHGVKWLSNINLALTGILFIFFMIFGAFIYGLKLYGTGLLDYLLTLPKVGFTAYNQAGTAQDQALMDWQKGWTVIYWAWWIAFAPFTGLFLARISKGRSIREFMIAAMIIPVLMSLLWFAVIGGTAVKMELSGVAQGAILNAGVESQLFVTLRLMLEPQLALIASLMVAVLIITYLVTSVDSGIIVLTTMMAGGNPHSSLLHRFIWGVILSLAIGVLLIVGDGMGSLKAAMILGALPFSIIMILMGISLIKGIWRDHIRIKHNIAID